MSFDQTPFKSFDAERNARLVAGLASPLWGAFFAAAGAGVAFWWMTAGVRRQFAGAPSFAAAEIKSFAPTEDATVSVANDFETVAPSVAVERAEAATQAFAAPVEAVVQTATVDTSAPADDATPPAPAAEVSTPVATDVSAKDAAGDVDPADGLAAAEEALADTQAEVAQMAAAGATAELAARPRRKKG